MAVATAARVMAEEAVVTVAAEAVAKVMAEAEAVAMAAEAAETVPRSGWCCHKW